MYAFPSGHNPKTGTQESGMTLRDYFAAKAMPAVISDWLKSNDFDYANGDAEKIARDVYLIADAILEARDK
jgi:hypothetical protein